MHPGGAGEVAQAGGGQGVTREDLADLLERFAWRLRNGCDGQRCIIKPNPKGHTEDCLCQFMPKQLRGAAIACEYATYIP